MPPPLISDPGTAVAATPLNVTLETTGSVLVELADATPIITILSLPVPRVCDQDSDVLPVLVVAALLAASKVTAADADESPKSRKASNSQNPRRILWWLTAGIASARACRAD